MAASLLAAHVAGNRFAEQVRAGSSDTGRYRDDAIAFRVGDQTSGTLFDIPGTAIPLQSDVPGTHESRLLSVADPRVVPTMAARFPKSGGKALGLASPNCYTP